MADTNQKQKDRDTPRVYKDGERWRGAEFANNTWYLRIEQGITKAQLLAQEFWAHVAEDLRPYDEIKVRCDDGTVYATLLVLDCGRAFANVQVLQWHNLTTADVAETRTNMGATGDYKIEWKGANKKFVITRLSDQQVIREGQDQRKESAEAFLRDFIEGKAHVAVPTGT